MAMYRYTDNRVNWIFTHIKAFNSQFKQKVTDTIASIQSQYWDLVSAIRDYEIKRESVKLARITLRDNTKKVEIGTLAPIGVTEAKAEVAEPRGRPDFVRRPHQPGRECSPGPGFKRPHFSDLAADDHPHRDSRVQGVQGSPRRGDQFGAGEPPGAGATGHRVQANDVSYLMSNNQKRYQIDLVGSFGSSGTAGPKTFSSSGVPLIRPELVGGIGTAYKTMFTQGFTSWVVGMRNS